MASIAILTLPSVPFLNPTGHESPEANLAVDLAFRRARADGRPSDEVGDVLRRGHVQELARGRQTERVDVQQQAPRQAQALLDMESRRQGRDR